AGGATVLAADPTRPPSQFLEPVAPAGVAAAPAAAPVTRSAEPAPRRAVPTPTLQAILRSGGQPTGALIDGWLVRIGDQVQDMRVVAIRAGEVELAGDGRQLRLSITPDVKRSARGNEPRRRDGTQERRAGPQASRTPGGNS
ncbi:MAG: hypothetical protein JSW68_09290, partial [Burkholderiales bacterium]